MPSALQTLHTIQPATTDASVRLGFVVFVRGPLRAHGDALTDLWSRLEAGLLRKRFSRFRRAGEMSWTTIPDVRSKPAFAPMFGMKGPHPGRWGLELAEDGGETGTESTGTYLQMSDLTPVRGMDRASHIQVLFPEKTTAVSTVASLGEWAINHLPLWWGSAGFVFHHTSGTMYTAHARMAALARRYWGVQILDLTCLQWDALKGMPGVNWLTLVGKELAEARGLSLDTVHEQSPDASVFDRIGPFGVVLAAGPRPTSGDINTGEDLQSYAHVARRLQPFLLTEHTPLFGPFAKPETLQAWLRRFIEPQAWLDCEIAAR